MAAMMGPDMMVGSATTTFDHSTTASDMTSKTPRSQVPLPNPPFVFPAKPTSSAPSGYSRATGRRPHSAIEPQLPSFSLGADVDKPVSRSPALPALPAFSFNPGNPLPPAALTESSFLSPTLPPSAPSSPRTIPTRPGGHGHRRGGSEFVGGSIRGGDSITVNLGSSPTKSESGLASPMLQPKRPAGRRGHAHRRSAAISSHDLSSIILPPTAREVKKDSPPASPATVEPPQELPLVSDEKSQPETTTTAIAVSEVPEPLALEPEVSTPPAEEPAATTEVQEPPKPAARTRVGFSDTLEYIPRPVSLVSSDTSSTITARPGHSVSGSISSVISITNVDMGLNTPLAFHSSPEINDRPSTAGAVLERTETVQEPVQEVVSPRRRGSIPLLGQIPPPSAYPSATPSPTKASKKWSFFGKDSSASSPTRCSESPKLSASAKSTPQRSPGLPAQELPAELAEMKPLTKKRSKKKKKVKTWAGSILSRKQSKKSRNGKGLRRTPTPTSRRSYSINEPADTGVESEGGMPTVLVTESIDPTEKGWDSYKPASLPDEETSYQMIDLDAALGPFNTPLPRNPEWEAAQRAGGTVKKQLHSAAGLRGFTGPGMHYHRRAESAPELVPFEGGRFGFPRFGSSSTMADVFEEDEEEDEEESPKSTGQSTPVMETPQADTFEESKKGKDVAKPTVDEQQETAPESVAVAPGVNTDEDGNASVKSSIHTGSLASRSQDALQQETDSPRPSFSGYQNELQARHSFSGSATPSPRQTSRLKDLSAVDCSPLTLPAAASCAPVSPHSMTPSSAFPSPRSPLSYDAHRISTAPSSITEDNFQSLLMGEPGPEVRISVDDVPSLTSGDSSMTRESFFAQNPQARQLGSTNTLPRPASFSASAFGRRRSSLASLSRLVSSSHGERSKLSMEVSVNDDGSEKKIKPSKTKRLGRFVQFWKSKENSEA
ncbi:hypothetical protein B0T20DRAFT_270637 [Sordaria brevicollis]|uniref:Cell wall proline rich protein n=1 Tax=Sordaria brevicollis TaxID=83679 RepID=A0AAE0PAP9_SORBR|nr:hypothetical protein B0T20DRAFT_270637 [Sordaria brevicollis]